VFAKIASGLFAGGVDGRRLKEMFRSPTTDPPPETGRVVNPLRVLAGLQLSNITGNSGRPHGTAWPGGSMLSPELEAEREYIINGIEEKLRSALGIDGPIFRRRIPADRGRAFVWPLSLVPSLRRRERDILRALNAELRSSASETSQQLWRFLGRLHAAGAVPDRAGAGVTIDHVYHEVGTLYEVTLRQRLIHVRQVERSLLVRAQQGHGARNRVENREFLAQVGTTGNAVNPHIHAEIEIMDGEVRLGFLTPIELAPLRSESDSQP
jgi:hypothetical protein